MTRKENDNILMEDSNLSSFFDNEDVDMPLINPENVEPATEEPEDFPGQLAVDVYETDKQLIIKARTAGVSKDDLEVSIADGILTINGTLSSGEETETNTWHIQECYWGEFNRTIALPVQVKEDEVQAVLKDGVLTIAFEKVQAKQAKKISIN